MFLTVDTNDKRPLYQQIVDGVKALIARGVKHAKGLSMTKAMKLPPSGWHESQCRRQAQRAFRNQNAKNPNSPHFKPKPHAPQAGM